MDKHAKWQAEVKAAADAQRAAAEKAEQPAAEQPEQPKKRGKAKAEK